MNGFRGGETHMAMDPNASHVLLYLINTQDAEVLKPFVTSFACKEICLKLARDRIGGRVLQELVNRLVFFVFQGHRVLDKNASVRCMRLPYDGVLLGMPSSCCVSWWPPS